MRRVFLVLCWVLVSLGGVSAQTGQSQQERALPQWLTGIIAVAGFLFLVFVAFLVNKAWCDKTSQGHAGEAVRVNDYTRTNGAQHDISMDTIRSRDNENAYENLAVDHTDDRITAM
ncbi:PDZK1-interacting protein 1 [Polymixia lowei]